MKAALRGHFYCGYKLHSLTMPVQGHAGDTILQLTTNMGLNVFKIRFFCNNHTNRTKLIELIWVKRCLHTLLFIYVFPFYYNFVVTLTLHTNKGKYPSGVAVDEKGFGGVVTRLMTIEWWSYATGRASIFTVCIMLFMLIVFTPATDTCQVSHIWF